MNLLKYIICRRLRVYCEIKNPEHTRIHHELVFNIKCNLHCFILQEKKNSSLSKCSE